MYPVVPVLDTVSMISFRECLIKVGVGRTKRPLAQPWYLISNLNCCVCSNSSKQTNSKISQNIYSKSLDVMDFIRVTPHIYLRIMWGRPPCFEITCGKAI